MLFYEIFETLSKILPQLLICAKKCFCRNFEFLAENSASVSSLARKCPPNGIFETLSKILPQLYSQKEKMEFLFETFTYV